MRRFQAKLEGFSPSCWDEEGVASVYVGYINNLRAVISRESELHWGCDFFDAKGNNLGGVVVSGLFACYGMAHYVAESLCR